MPTAFVLHSAALRESRKESKAAGLMREKETRTLVVRRVHEEARDVRAFDVLPEGASDCHEMPFTPGQVALLEVEGAGRAYFAIASAPEDDELEFLVKRSDDPVSRALYETKPGGRVRLAEIAGHGFDLKAQEGRDLVCGSREMIAQTRDRLQEMGFEPERILTNY